MNDSRRISPDESGSPIRNLRLVPDLPDRFVSEDYDVFFLSRMAGLFRDFLAGTIGLTAMSFEARISLLRKMGLLELSIPKLAEFAPFEVAISKPGSDNEKRHVYTGEVTVPWGFAKLNWSVTRESLLDDGYVSELVSVMAYLFACKVLPGASRVTLLTLRHIDLSVLEKFLKDYNRSHLTGECVARLIGLAKVNQAIDEMDGLKVFDRLAVNLARKMEDSSSQFQVGLNDRLERMVADYKNECSPV